MGTEAQKQVRQAAAARQELIDQAKSRGQIRSNTDLANFIASLGGNPSGPQYKQNYSGGGYSLYGPSWDPGWNFDFEHNQKIPWQGPGEDWYDPSKAENWQNTDPLQAGRMSGFFKWRDQNMDMIDKDWGGNASAAWYALRAKSDRPNSPDMAWWNEGNKGVGTVAPTSTTTSTAISSQRQPITKPAEPAYTGVSQGASPYGILNPNANAGLPVTTNFRNPTRKPGVSTARPSVPWNTTWKF